MSFHAIQTCRPHPMPPYIQKADEEVIGILERKSLSYIQPEYRPPPKPPRIQDNAEEKIWPPPKIPKIQIIGKEGKIWNYMPPPNPLNIENIDMERN